MIKKLLIFSVVFYLMALLQTGFLVHFNLWGFYPNFLLLAVIFINLFEKADCSFGLIAAFWGGFLSDIFSSSSIGYHILICLAFSLAIKLIIKRYVWTPAIR